ncbi:MAG: 16S rRNA (guanine(527)-N(7))-methyltransferase RsmG [Burkholderiaceae bacterium]|nr:MAG: 16S rRNA (guanine(527)-N(7))-methyltransferase RsmG [Burkholderiaceae bacterium]
MEMRGEGLAQQLAEGVAALRLDLSPAQQTRLLDYLALLAKWNAVYNLTAIRDPQAMLVQHLLDSLAIVPELALHTQGRPFRLLDVGSGGGLPGIPAAIAMPQAQVMLIDPVHKKTAFLTQVKAGLQLSNLRVLTGKAEEVRAVEVDARYDVITSRAFSSLGEFVQLAQHLLAPEGFFAAMKGVVPEEEIRALPSEFHAYGVIPLQVPGLDAERCLVLIRKK